MAAGRVPKIWGLEIALWWKSQGRPGVKQTLDGDTGAA